MSDLTEHEKVALDWFRAGMQRRLEQFTGERTVEGSTEADVLWLLMRAKKNLDHIIGEVVSRTGHPSALDLYDAANLMALADWLWRQPRKKDSRKERA